MEYIVTVTMTLEMPPHLAPLMTAFYTMAKRGDASFIEDHFEAVLETVLKSSERVSLSGMSDRTKRVIAAYRRVDKKEEDVEDEYERAEREEARAEAARSAQEVDVPVLTQFPDRCSVWGIAEFVEQVRMGNPLGQSGKAYLGTNTGYSKANEIIPSKIEKTYIHPRWTVIAWIYE